MESEQAARLAELRGYLDWSQQGLDDLAEQAAMIGRLCDAYEVANRERLELTVGSSNSSATITPASVPPSGFSRLPNVQATFYAVLQRECRRVLGLPLSLRVGPE